MTLDEHMKDGGFKSRKLWICVFGVKVITLGWFASAHWSALTPSYPTFVGGVLGLVALYFGGNVGTKATIIKGSLAQKPSPSPEQNG